MYFLRRHRLPPDKSEYLHIELTYDCWHCFLVFNIWASHALEMTIHFNYPTLELFCFSFTQPFTHSKFCLPNPFLFGATSPQKKIMTLTKKLDWLKHQCKLTSYCRHSLQTPTTFDYKRQHHGLSVLEVPCKVRLKTRGIICLYVNNREFKLRVIRQTPAEEKFYGIRQ
jgi:hypothetical protein